MAKVDTLLLTKVILYSDLISFSLIRPRTPSGIPPEIWSESLQAPVRVRVSQTCLVFDARSGFEEV